MSTWIVTYYAPLELVDRIDAAYYVIEDGWAHFKTAAHKQIKSIREGAVLSIEKA